MKKLIGIVTAVIFALALILPTFHHAAEAAFSDWKCSQCGKTQHKAGETPPSISGCKVSQDGKHIWFRTK